jgi:hypothetical protein
MRVIGAMSCNSAALSLKSDPDPKSRYGEPHAQEDVSVNPPNEMNPLTWTLIVEEGKTETPIPQPPHYDERRYWGTTSVWQKGGGEAEMGAPVIRPSSMAPWPAEGA